MSSTDPTPSPVSRPGVFRRTFRRHLWAILGTWLLGSLGLLYLAYVKIPPTYRALCLLRVDPLVVDLYGVRPAEPLEPFLKTQVQLITSPNVLTAAGTNPKAAVLERLQKAGDVVQELRGAVQVSIIPDTYLLEVSMTSTNGYEAATIVNAVVDAFIEANSEWSDGMTRQQIKNLEQYSVDLRNQTDELERKWKKLAAKGDIDDGNPPPAPGDPRAQVTVEEYRQARQELNSVKIELAQAQAWLTAAKAALNRAANKNLAPVEEKDLLDKQVERRFALDPEVTALLGELKRAEAKVSEARRITNEPEDPGLKAAKSKYDELKARHQMLWEERSAAIREQIALGGVNGLDPDQEIREAQAAINKLLAKQGVLVDQFQRLDVKNKTQATDAVEIALIQDERETLKGMQDAVTRRLEQLRFQAKGEARIRPVNPNGAMVPTRPLPKKPGLGFDLIPLATLFGVLCLFLGFEAFAGPKAEVTRDAA